ncbi:MAG: KH domain-containing protein [Candidatus Woesearchaeota archaeon]|jgi:ribosomal RNA assembly protein|nr:KH domain-containing protein [Candidatus Woesearchaeota archaeon]
MTSTPKQEFSYELRIPKERVAVLIGKKGEIKRTIEHETKTKVQVNSEEGIVSLNGEDALLLYMAREIVRAIGRGFNPDIALLLLKQDYGFELIPIQDYVKTENDLERLKGRVIGEGGKSRKTIEELTQTNVCVFGKTAGIIGPAENINTARRAIESLLAGSPHAHVYRWLERQRTTKRATWQ